MAKHIRELAQRAADAAKNSATLIQGTTDKVRDGAAMVNIARDAFADIAAQSDGIRGGVTEITNTTTRQTAAIERINDTVTDMDEITRQYAAYAEQSAMATREMRGEADRMASVVGELTEKLGVNRISPPAEKMKSIPWRGARKAA